MKEFNFAVWAILFGFTIYQLIRSIRIVPAQKAYIVERLGKYKNTLEPGFHILFPYIDKVTYIHDLREESIHVPPQMCFTSDNVRVEVDGVIYIQIMDPQLASYGVTDHRFAAIQLAQTTVRSVFGTLDLDRTFEERELINSKIMEVLAEVADTWGIKVHRYEVKNIVPPGSVRVAMERQMTAERERRAILATAQGEKEKHIRESEGLMNEMVNVSEGEKQKRINEAEGKASEIRSIADATASAIEKIADAISVEGGKEAVSLQVSEKYLSRLNGLARKETEVVLPADLMDVDSILSSIGLKKKA